MWNQNNEAGSEKACDTFTNDTLQKPSNAGHENQDWPKTSLFLPSYAPIASKWFHKMNFFFSTHTKKNQNKQTLLRSETIVEVEIRKCFLKGGGATL